jgi:hypothetical protein
MIDFDLGTERGTGSPDASAGMPQENFSVRWTGALMPTTTGTYTFYVDGDGQINLSTGSDLVLEKNSPGRSEVSKEVTLTANQPVVVKIEYIHATGKPSLHVSWAGPDFARKVLTPIGNAGAH